MVVVVHFIKVLEVVGPGAVAVAVTVAVALAVSLTSLGVLKKGTKPFPHLNSVVCGLACGLCGNQNLNVYVCPRFAFKIKKEHLLRNITVERYNTCRPCEFMQAL